MCSSSLLFCSFFSQNLLDVIVGSLFWSFLDLFLVLAQNLILCLRWDVHDLYLGRRQLHGSIGRSNSWNEKQSSTHKAITSISHASRFQGRVCIRWIRGICGKRGMCTWGKKRGAWALKDHPPPHPWVWYQFYYWRLKDNAFNPLSYFKCQVAGNSARFICSW